MELSTPKVRMRVAFELADLAYEMKRQQFRRRHPDATESDLDQWMSAWQRSRPGAEHGDASGPGFHVSHRLDYLKKQ